MLAAGVLLACTRTGPESGLPVVAVSVPPQGWVVERLAGDRVRVELMVPPGANPVTHEPTLAQLRALSRAVLYVKVGHPGFAFERAWLERMLDDLPELPVVDGAAGVSLEPGDPHYWVAPQALGQMARTVAEALSEVLPGAGGEVSANLAVLLGEVDRLDVEIRERLSGSRGKRFFVFHPAWGYFARSYGLEQVSIEHDHKQPDVRALAELVRRARADGVRTVFVQPQFDPSAAETLAREVGASVQILDPLARDWDDNLRRAARALAEASR